MTTTNVSQSSPFALLFDWGRMEFISGDRAAVTDSDEHKRRHCSSIFKLPSNFTTSFRFIELLSSYSSSTTAFNNTSDEIQTASEKNLIIHTTDRLTCNTCNYSFHSLHDQRSHFKSDFHRFNNVEEYYDKAKHCWGVQMENQFRLGDEEKIRFEHDLSGPIKDDDTPFVTVREVIEKVLNVINEPRNNTCLRVILLASAGHFAGCVFDGNTVVTHKTFHRYVVRAKAGKKQSAEDAGGNIAHSAGASIRRHNELALTKDIRELLTAWKPYFDLSTAIFIHAPSHNRKQLFNGENPCFRCQKHVIRHIPLTVQRPTFKEAQRLYKILTQISTEPDEETSPVIKEDSTSTLVTENTNNNLEIENLSEDDLVKNVQRVHMSLPLHEAAKAGNAEKVLELLEQGSDPCVIDERGRTAYRLAAGKEVRNTFRRFMALNPDTWDWQAAKVPSPLTKEMEKFQNVKQANKDAKGKARAKELIQIHKAP
ncbi:putative transcription factor C2H2 family [Helianthus annuus]|nr:putative transcription factor C2H2 family [Helianthus annuus]